MPKITAIIRPDGRIEIEGHEFKGQACQQAIDAIIAGMGAGIVEESNPKPEFDATEGVAQKATA